MASNRKRKIEDVNEDDNINFGKEFMHTRSKGKMLGNKVDLATVSKVTEITKTILPKLKQAKSKTIHRKQPIIVSKGNNNNAVPMVVKSNKSKTIDLDLNTKKNSKIKQTGKTKVTKPVKSNKGIPVLVKTNDGILLDVDDSEFNEEDQPDNEMGDVEDEDSDGEETIAERRGNQPPESVSLGATASTLNSENEKMSEQDKARRLLLEHPELKNLVNQMLDDRMDEFKQSIAAEKEEKSTGNPQGVCKTPVSVNKGFNNPVINKSPSDTTLYRPIFGRENNVINSTLSTMENGERNLGNLVIANAQQGQSNNKADTSNVEMSQQIGNISPSVVSVQQKSIMEKISNFVESLRMDVDEQIPTMSGHRSEVNVPGQTDTRKKVDRTVLEAEKFKATISTPPGKTDLSYSESDVDEAAGLFKADTRQKSDDNFIHLTCHVDQTLTAKIEKGEFVDLERLLPKDRFGVRPNTNEQRMEWVRSDEGTFLVPTGDKSAKINSFKKWEQAFRVYATIYCGANPSRAKEIWQYVSIINTAASSFVWDNVANYDYTFRQLMAYNPERSWAITYHHMWSLAMKDPIQKGHIQRQVNYFGGNGSHEGGSRNGGNYNSNNNMKKWSKTPDYCWSFNKGQTCKYGKNCKFIERCSYCDKASHGVYICPKVDGKLPPTGSPKTNHKGNGNKGHK